MQSSRCLRCKHLREGLTCAAFTRGIPEKILLGEHLHTVPLENQKNNIVFEERDDL